MGGAPLLIDELKAKPLNAKEVIIYDADATPIACGILSYAGGSPAEEEIDHLSKQIDSNTRALKEVEEKLDENQRFLKKNEDAKQKAQDCIKDKQKELDK